MASKNAVEGVKSASEPAVNGAARNNGVSVAANNGIATGAKASPNGKASASKKKQAPVVSEEERTETREWLESLEWVLQNAGSERVAHLLEQLESYAHRKGVKIPFSANTPYVNTIPRAEQP
jgi:hypothetical protein